MRGPQLLYDAAGGIAKEKTLRLPQASGFGDFQELPGLSELSGLPGHPVFPGHSGFSGHSGVPGNLCFQSA